MASITLTYAISDGNTLSPSGYNENLYSTTAGNSIYGELNGNLEAANLSGSFSVQPEHARAGEHSRVYKGSNKDSLDFFDNTFSSQNASATWVTIPGTALNIYVPYNFKAAMIQWEVFASAWRIGVGDGAGGAVAAAPAILFRAYLDGSSLGETTRQMPESIYTDGALGTRYFTKEDKMTRLYSGSYLCCNAASEGVNTQLTAGWHTFDLRLFMEAQTGSDSIAWPPHGGGAGTTNLVISAQNRITFGIKSVQIVGLL